MNRLAIIVAMTDECTDLDAKMVRFVDEAGPHGGVILVDATTRGVDRPIDVRVLRRPAGTLVPLLWRDGLDSTDASLVAFTTAAMMPPHGWLVALKQALESSDHAGVGGPIVPGDRLSMTDRAVALLRYSSYFPPLPDPSRMAPPGENALYIRDRLTEVESTWTDGFWEIAVQQALRAHGHSLIMSESAVVSFEGGTSLFDMVRRRLAHGRNYGGFRTVGLGLGARMARVMAMPIVPGLLALRVLSALRARRISIFPWLGSLPSLMILATAWAVGEAIGTCPDPRKSRSLARTPVHVKFRACEDQP